MTYTNAHIHPQAAALLPNLRIVALTVTGLGNLQPLPLDALRAECLQKLATRGLPLESLATVPPFSAWRAAFGTMGLQPSKFRCSVEALTRRALNTGAVPAIGIPLVDLYNIASINFLTPMGGYDLATISAPIQVRLAQSTDTFTPIGGDAKDFPLTEKVVVYAQQNEVLCFGLNHRDNARTSITASTQEAVFFAEGLTDIDAGAAKEAMEWLAAVLTNAGAVCSEVTSLEKSHDAA